MGTNFYLGGRDGKHIGKRSAAGLYCWDCDDTLCPEGKAMVHTGSADWPTTCPKCGKTDSEPGAMKGAAAVELGFAKPEDKRPTGVYPAASFSWAMHPVQLVANQSMVIVDEYGKRLSKARFLKMLAINCPIQYYHSIGWDFT